MTSDQVEVAFIHRGRQIETRVCSRPDAHKLGMQMVTTYASLIRGNYAIRELPAIARKTKPVSKPQIKVSHYFTIVT